MRGMVGRAQQRGPTATRSKSGLAHGSERGAQGIEQIQAGEEQIQMQREVLARGISPAFQVSTPQNKWSWASALVDGAKQGFVPRRIRRFEKASERSAED